MTKVDSQAKVFLVKSDHLSVAGAKFNFMKQSDGVCITMGVIRSTNRKQWMIFCVTNYKKIMD